MGQAVSAARFDRAEIMRDAWGAGGMASASGWDGSFGQCLSTAWAAAKIRRTAERKIAA